MDTGETTVNSNPIAWKDAALSRSARGAALLWLIAVVVALAVGGVLVWQHRSSGPAKETTLTWVAAREKLRISVVEAGQLKAAKSVDIYCEVKGGATILELVDEGTKVQEGDTLVRLDASNLEDELTAQKIRKLNAEASKIQADKTKQIQESKNQSDIDKGGLDLNLAVTDLKKYEEGDYELKRKQSESDITLARADEELKSSRAKDTEDLVTLDFAAKTEADSDRLAARQALVKRQMAELSSEMLEKWEKPRQLQVLTAAVGQARSELERVKLRCEADMAQKNADFESKKATFDLEQNKLVDLEEQLSRTMITAPSAGLVVYPVNQGGMGGMGRSDRDRVEEGATAREHQLLISLPDTREMVVVVSVHESAIDKLKLGQPAVVTIDALPDSSFIGKVTFIAPLPDSQNQWLNPDLKVYRCEIALGGDTTILRPGMSASVEIVIDELTDTISVPIHAVHRRGDHYFVYADTGGRPEIRAVKIGMHNDKRVAITEGASEGDKVFLAIPPGAPQPDFGPDEKKESESSVAELRQKADSIVTKNGKPEEPKPGAAKPAGAFDFSKFQTMTPEERKKAWEDYLATLTPEKRKEIEDRMKQLPPGGGGFGGAPGGAPGGGAGGGPGGPPGGGRRPAGGN